MLIVKNLFSMQCVCVESGHSVGLGSLCQLRAFKNQF